MKKDLIIKSTLLFSIFLLLFQGMVLADVQSSTGNIFFDVDSSGSYEMTLNSNGLGIGTSPSSNLHVAGNTIITGNLSIGSTSIGNSTLNLNGSIGFNLQTVSTNTTLNDNSYILVDTSSANLYITLPYAGNATGRIYKIKKISTDNKLWISAKNSYIDSSAIHTLSANATELPRLTAISNGTQWYLLDASSQLSQLASDNLIGWWKLDETSGTTAADSTSSANNGTLTGDYTFSSNSISGVLGNGLNSDGTNEYINFGNVFNMGTSDFSISMWVKTTDSDNNTLYNKWASGTSEGYWSWIDTGRPRHEISASSTRVTTTTTGDRVDDGNWHHVVGVYDRDGNISAYVDGVLQTTVDISAHSATNITNTRNFEIARFGFATTTQYQGGMDDIRFYNKALTLEEIKALYSSGN